MVAVSSMEHPITNQSNLEISFCNEEICPGHIFFNCSNGSAVGFKNPLNDFNIQQVGQNLKSHFSPTRKIPSFFWENSWT